MAPQYKYNWTSQVYCYQASRESISAEEKICRRQKHAKLHSMQRVDRPAHEKTILITSTLIPRTQSEIDSYFNHAYEDESRSMRFSTMRYVRPAKAQTSLCIRAFDAQSDQSLSMSLEYFMTEHHLEFLSLKGSSESTLGKMSHCWKCCGPIIQKSLMSKNSTVLS